VNVGRILWVVGAYFAGMSAVSLAAFSKAGRAALSTASRNSSEADAHILLRDNLGFGWMVLFATMDVAKAGLYPLAARTFGPLPDSWTALVGFVLVTGYAFPLFFRATAGRGLAGAAGALLALLPIPMVIGGLVILLGMLVHRTGPASTLGFAVIPIAAAIQGQPAPYIAMACGLLGLIVVRRLEGVSVAAAQWGWPLALWRRLVFDQDLPAEPRPEGIEGREAPQA
jgi:glycerol-3-phosphate acyltransferase PlsY